MQPDSILPCGLCRVVDCNHRRANRLSAIDPTIGALLIRPCDCCGVEYSARFRNLIKGEGRFCSRRCVQQSRVKRPAAERFWRSVERRGPDECWPWRRGRSRYGYGAFMLDQGKQIVASRYAYILTHGPIATIAMVCHSCDNPPCCNPAHLFLGTKTDNMVDRDSKGRQARGERGGTARLTEDDVRAIRIRYAAGNDSQQRIADEYGISQFMISAIVRRAAWKHVE